MVTRDSAGFIYELQKDEYIVVGTNRSGHHGAGAAKYAMDYFGLEWGCGSGISGNTYALSTMEGWESLTESVIEFIKFAISNPDKLFYLTSIGTGIAGYEKNDMIPLFSDIPSNVIRPIDW